MCGCSSKDGHQTGNINLNGIDDVPIEKVTSIEVINLESSGLLKKEELEITENSIFDNESETKEIYAEEVTIEEPDEFLADEMENEKDVILDEVEEREVSQFVTSPNELEQNIPETVEYIVQKKETLMLISYKLYGDYKRWKDIAEANKNLLTYKNMKEGVTILVPAPSYNHKKNHARGTPYLILKDDTLGSISNFAYKTTRHWKFIWKNNLNLIKDPNTIFAGFTLYYLPLSHDNNRVLASEPDQL